MQEKLKPYVGSPSSVDWCHIKKICPCASLNCGIKKHLKEYYGKRKKAEAERLFELAQTDPERFFKICLMF